MSFHAAESILILALLAVPASAQEPVVPWADTVSWGTALVNPTIATVQALRSDQPKCRLAQLGISAAITNGVGLTLQHFIVSPRPCVGCPPHGWPSLHTATSGLGVARDWRLGVGFVWSTAALRVTAKRHTAAQVAAGAVLGVLSEWAGHRLLRCE